MYGVVVAERGVGKSPTMRVFFDPLAKIEKEEQDDYIQKIASKKRKRSTDGAGDESTDPGEIEEHDLEEEDNIHVSPGRKNSGKNRNRFRMNPCTRLVEGITPEALILALHHTTGSMVIKCDEMKVIIPFIISSSGSEIFPSIIY